MLIAFIVLIVILSLINYGQKAEIKVLKELLSEFVEYEQRSHKKIKEALDLAIKTREQDLKEQSNDNT